MAYSTGAHAWAELGPRRYVVVAAARGLQPSPVTPAAHIQRRADKQEGPSLSCISRGQQYPFDWMT